MRVDFIPLGNLSIDRTNMRHGRKMPDVAELLPTLRKRGILQTLLVGPGCMDQPDTRKGGPAHDRRDTIR
jgi:ParB family chromosome partitioning protein